MDTPEPDVVEGTPRRLAIVDGPVQPLAPHPGNADTAAKARAGRRAKMTSPTATFAEIPKLWDGYVLLTTQAGAAAIMNVTAQTIRSWVRDGKIQAKYTPSGRPRIVVASLWREGEAPIDVVEAERAAQGLLEPTTGDPDAAP